MPGMGVRPNMYFLLYHGIIGGYYLIGTEFQLGKIKKLETDGDDHGCTVYIHILNAIELYT